MNPICTKKFHRLQCLIDSCKSGDDRKLKYILDTEDCDSLLDSSDQNGRSLLHYCAEHQNTECASLLLQKRPQLLNLQDDDGCTPLHLATISGNVPFLGFLVNEARKILEETNFNLFIDCYDNENHTAHHWATVCGEVGCIKVLHSVGADPSLPDIHGAHPIHYASQLDSGSRKSSRRNEVIDAILSYAPTERDARDKDGRTPLLWAASSGNVEAIELLTKLKANVALQDLDGLTALHCAASRGYLECIECLLELCGSQVDQTDWSGASALFYAVTLGHADCSQFLLQEGAAPNRQDRKGRTPAHCGAAKGQLETLKILYQNGGNLWLRNSRGDLPLHEAVKSGRKELVRWLLEQVPSGSDFPNSSGKTPIHVACFNGSIEMCQILLEYGMDVNAQMKSKSGWMTPLDVCLLKGFRSCAKFILLHGALPASKLPEYGSTFCGNSSQDAILDTESHSSTQSYIKEVRIPSKTRLRNITKTVTSQRVQVLTDGIATPNSCVETTLSTDSRPETIITNVYVNTCSEPRKKSTLSKLIRKRSKKQSRSVISGSSSEAKKQYDEDKVSIDDHIYQDPNKASGDTDGKDETFNVDIGVDEYDGTGEIVEKRRVEIAQKERNDHEHEKDENHNDKVIQVSRDSLGGIEFPNPQTLLQQNEQAVENIEDNENVRNGVETSADGQQSGFVKKRSKRSAGEQNESVVSSPLSDEREGEQIGEGVKEYNRDIQEEEDDVRNDRVTEVVEYAQELANKIIDSGKVIDEQFSETALNEPITEVVCEGDVGNSGQEFDPGVDDVKKEILSEGAVENDGEVSNMISREGEGLMGDDENKIMFHDTDSNSLHESISADETVVASIDDPAAGREETHVSSTAFEIHDHVDEDSVDEGGRKTSVRRKKSTARGRRKNQSHCSHKYHFKQSFTTIQPLDLQHIRPKVDTGRSSSCAKSFSRSSDRTSEIGMPPSELLRGHLSLKKYYTERKLFEELRELKRCQIRSDRAHESILVKKLIDTFQRDVDYPGLTKYAGSYDYKSYERYLYDQLRLLSHSNQGKLMKHSSEENIAPVHKMFQDEPGPRRTCSAEHLGHARHQPDRFLRLDDHHPIVRSPRQQAEWRNTCYHKAHSDVVRTAESLDYAIITRDGSTNVFRKETAIKFEPHTCLPPLLTPSSSRLRAHQTGKIETSKKVGSISQKSTTPGVGFRVKEDTKSNNSRHTVFYASGNLGTSKAFSSKSAELKRKKTQIPPHQRVNISEEEITRRWQPIKDEEKQRKNHRSSDETKARSSPNLSDFTLLYEVNGTQSAPSHRKRIERTTSEPRVSKFSRVKKK